MSYAAAKTITIDEIPVIDVHPLRSGNRQAMQKVARKLRQAAEGIGFFYIRNHCIPSQVIQQAYAVTKQFFRQPKDWKNQLKINHNHHGFLAVGQAKMEKATRVDLKESFVWGLDLPDGHPDLTVENPFLGRNQWPSQMPEFRASVYPFFEAGLECGRDMMRAFALSLDLPEEVFLQATNQPIARSSVIYYPPQPSDLGETQFGVAPHTDYGCLTLLWQDSVGGLEVQTRQGEWVTAHPLEDTLVVNVGDLLSRWTNNAFQSTLHRVINRKSIERYSMVIAWDPNFETWVDPAEVFPEAESVQYAPVQCGEYVLSRFDASFSYRKAAQSA